MIDVELVSNIYFWLWLAVVFVQTIVTFSAVGTCFKPKCRMLWFCTAGSFLCVGMLALANIFIGEHPFVKSSIMIAVPIMYSVYFSEGNSIKKTIFYLICLTVDSIIEVCVNLCIELWNLTDMASMGEYTLHRVMLTVFSLMIMVPVKYCAARILAVFTVLSVANIIYLHYIADIEERNRLVLRLRGMEYAHQLEAEHYTRIEEKRYELAKLRHDFRNEISAVKKLISTGNHDSAQELLSDIEKTLNDTSESKYCSVPVIDAVMTEKERMLSENGISFEHSITVAGAEAVQSMHLCSIFANLMDNAIKANLKIEDSSARYINLVSKIKGGAITIKCENPVKASEVIPEPSKSSGYGLKILSDIASLYDGRFSISSDNGICTAAVTLNLNCNSEQ